MKLLPIICYLGAAVWQLGTHCRDFFPNNPAERGTIDLCFCKPQI